VARSDYKTCKRCRRHVAECGTLSHERLCETCGDERRYANWRALIEHRGPEFQHWRRRCVAALGAVLADDAPSGH